MKIKYEMQDRDDFMVSHGETHLGRVIRFNYVWNVFNAADELIGTGYETRKEAKNFLVKYIKNLDKTRLTR